MKVWPLYQACEIALRLQYASRQDLLQRAVELALSVGAKVALDLASFEVVREFRADVEALLQSGRIECCFCNEVFPPPCTITPFRISPKFIANLKSS